ncbi:MAG TPA: CHAT domain-containing tetratricopeptide repeat protein [Pyrinomonadaceae bacterium]|nr:CHAT domain-containing tetratricopeptide repeat protein [Pyrinomonadaceae bacterium]
MRPILRFSLSSAQLRRACLTRAVSTPTARVSLALIICFLLLGGTGAAQTDAAKTQNDSSNSKGVASQEQPKELPQLIPQERELKGGETHSYRVPLTSGQFFYALVDQKGIDVAIVLSGPDGHKLAETDSPNDRWGPEPVMLIADASGDYRVDVRSANSKAPAGRYEVRIIASREAVSSDKAYVAAQRIFDEGARLRFQQTAVAKRAAIVKYEEAVSLFQAAGDTYKQALTIDSIGIAYAQLNEFRTALPYFEKTLTLSQGLHERRLEAAVETLLGGAYDVLGETRKALDHYDRALSLARESNNHIQEASALNNIGKIYNDMSDWQKALDYYLQALPLFRELGNQRTEGLALNNIGVIYNMVGEQQKAIDYLQQSLVLLHASGDKSAESSLLSNIGNAFSRFGDYQKALSYYDQAQAIQRETGNRAKEGETLDLFGATYSALGQPQKALEYHQKALVIHRATGNQRQEGLSLSNLGFVYSLLGQPVKALDYFNQSLTIFRNIGDLNNAAGALEGSARAERDRGNLVDARKRIEESLTLIETVRARGGSQQLRASYLASMEKAYEFFIGLLMELHAKDPGKGHDAEALQASERGRARSLTEMLNEAHVDIRAGVGGDLIKRERELSQLLNAKAQRQIQLTARKGNQQEIETLKKEIGALEDEYQQVQVAIRKASPAYAALTQPQPLGLKEIQAQLDQGTMLLEYSLGEERSYVWAVTQNSLKTYELPKRVQIEKAARLVYDLLTARSQSKSGESPQQKQERIAQADSELINASRSLSRMVLDPVAAGLGSERLVVVADGALQYVPFTALSAPDKILSRNAVAAPGNSPQTSGYGPLILDREIVSLPSASALAVQRDGLRNRKPAPNVLAVIADPVFTSTDERLGVRKRIGTPKQAGDSSSNTRIIEHLADDSGLIIRRLKFTRQEADQILAEAPRAKNLKAIDFKANRATATGGELSKYRYVHFATHGYIDSEHPDLSAIVLSLVDAEGKPQDGFLRANEIYNLNLPAELVVLSACETGLGKEIKGEGLVGLTQGFMYAGARRVVVSLWNVNDKATAELMARFYRGMLREHKTPAAALRTAQMEMSRQKQWQSPYYWAAFTLQGEWK